MSPLVSVVIPIHNAETYVKEAVQSLLGQTFMDFELLIVNDCSTDKTASILDTFLDPRIIRITNQNNLGVAKTLNVGIQHARGKYIARMDADDIALPTRLAEQVAFLQQSPPVVAGVAVKAYLIDASGKRLEQQWQEDWTNETPRAIRKCLTRTNCLVHPGMMLRADVLRRFKYDSRQIACEDYDLWLRLMQAGYEIAKLPEPLLEYRVHNQSVTQTAGPVLDRLIACKKRFLRKTPRNQSPFYWQVAASLQIDRLLRIKEQMQPKVLSACIRGIAWWGQPLGYLFPSNPSGLFFFFPTCRTGGADNVHLQIVRSVQDRQPWVILTESGASPHQIEQMKKHARVIDLHRWLKQPLFYALFQGIWATIVNRSPHPVVFGANCSFYYRMMPFLGKHCRTIDLIHAFGGGVETFSLPFVSFLSSRVAITDTLESELRRLYSHNSIDEQYADRIKVIGNAVTIPATIPSHPVEPKKLRVLFVGRGSEEKRIHLAARIAMETTARNSAISFRFIGPVEAFVPEAYRSSCAFAGEITRVQELEAEYQSADALLLTSNREGFPLVIMEAMANGVVPVATAVGSIGDHVVSDDTGFLIDPTNEGRLVETAVVLLLRLADDRTLLSRLSQRARARAVAHFSTMRFEQAYRSLLAVEQS